MDLFSTNVLNRVVQSLITPQSFLLDRFFPNEQTDQSEEIHFDVLLSKRRLAPLVSPLVQGKIVESLGYRTDTFPAFYSRSSGLALPYRVDEATDAAALFAVQRNLSRPGERRSS